MGTAEAEIVGFDFGLESAFEGGFDYWEEALVAPAPQVMEVPRKATRRGA